jgi:hypothetical protein
MPYASEGQQGYEWMSGWHCCFAFMNLELNLAEVFLYFPVSTAKFSTNLDISRFYPPHTPFCSLAITTSISYLTEHKPLKYKNILRMTVKYRDNKGKVVPLLN